MKLASIVPMKYAHLLFDGDYAMLLAHLADKYPKKRKNCYTIMDNSLIEMGGAINIATVYKAAVKCNADELILPDVFKNKRATLKAVRGSLNYMKDKGLLNNIRIMAVAQGSNEKELRECFHALEKVPEIHCIGIPKVAETLHKKGRPGFEDMWINSPKEIHLLGCWSSLTEVTQYRYPAKIRSMDTCLPALLSREALKTHTIGMSIDRPKKTIDLLNDEMDLDAYSFILKQVNDCLNRGKI